MKINTLILSGGGINCISLLGSFQYLFEENIIQKNFKGIQTIICVSGSIINILPLLLNFSIDAITKIFLSYDNLMNYDDFNINDIFNNFGLYNNKFIKNMVEILLSHKGYNKNLTLQELFKITKKKLIIKVVNLSQNKIVYISHKSNPNIKVSTVCCMTTCIPIFFQPILYKNNYFVDGGLCGNLPIDYIHNKTKYKDYLAINIISTKEKSIETFQDYLLSIFRTPFSPYDHRKNKKIVTIQMDEIGLDLNSTKDKKTQKYKQGYIQTKEHFNNQTQIY
tara:strand:- start:106 stop:942 length:837 start_codon:yes stop_codon:yes gene_type:complete